MVDDPLRSGGLGEGQKAFIFINAVGAVVLLAFLQAIWATPGGLGLKKGVLHGIVAFALGVLLAALGPATSRPSPSRVGRFVQKIRSWFPALVAMCFLAGVILPVLGAYDSLNLLAKKR